MVETQVKNTLYGRVRMPITIMVPWAETCIHKEETPLEATRQMNTIFKILANKLPWIHLGPWIENTDNKSKTDKFLKDLSEDVGVVEIYQFNFSIFVSPGERLYCRLHVYYDLLIISIAEIESAIQGF